MNFGLFKKKDKVDLHKEHDDSNDAVVIEVRQKLCHSSDICVHMC